MQIIVLGMHRSGTSTVARLLNMMGAYFAPEGMEMPPDSGNPKGYWERRDVYTLNKEFLWALHCDWYRVSHLDLNQASEEAVAAFQEKARKIILGMDANRPWMLKEPRMNLLLPLWYPLLECPLAIHVYRNPLQVAKSIHRRNGFPIQFNLALWEFYTLQALRHSQDMPTLLLSYEALVRNPHREVTRLYEQLLSLGVQGLHVPDLREIQGFIDASLLREKAEEHELDGYLNHQQASLYAALKDGSILEWTEIPVLSAGALEQLLLFEARRAEEEAQALTLREHQTLIRTNQLEHETALAELRTAHEQQLAELQAALDQQAQQVNQAHEQQLAELQAALDQQAQQADQVLFEKGQALLTANQQAFDLDQKLRRSAQSLRAVQQQLDTAKQAETALQQDLLEREARLYQVQRWLEQLQHDSVALFASQTWKAGHWLTRTAQRLLLRKPTPGAQAHMLAVIAAFQAWQQQRLLETSALSGVRALGEAETSRLSAPVLGQVDIVICIHNALADVQLCLQSVLAHTPEQHRLILVNDGSDDETRAFLQAFQAAHAHCVLLENATAQGYTKAANLGLRATHSDSVVLLNSDTVVPRLWLPRLIDCADSDPTIGIVGPLSNAASWQSVPERFGAAGDWAINSLPPGFSVNEMAELVHQASQRTFPRVPFVNGFCFLLKRRLIERIGYLDEAHFPKGYGEENDYCLRAAEAGFSLAIADHCYVYHAKSKSYTHERRAVLAREGDAALKQKHGSKHIAQLVKGLRDNHELALTRERIQACLQDQSLAPNAQALRMLFVLPVGGIGGGIHSIVQEAAGLRRLGVEARIAIPLDEARSYQLNYPRGFEAGELFYFYHDLPDLFSFAERFEGVIATTWDSPALLAPFFDKNPHILPLYYVQDYEPWFFEEGSEQWQIAYDSYTRVEGMQCFAKTAWLCDIVAQKHGVPVGKVAPSLDRDVYYYPASAPSRNPVLGIVAMIRPVTPRRGAVRTMQVLQHIKQAYGKRVRIDLFGCDEAELSALPHAFEYRNHGVLVKEAIADLYRNADIFIDFSDYQAFGRTGLEAMACGCAVILPITGGAHEYAVHEDNALLVDTREESRLIAALKRLLDDSALHERLQNHALRTAKTYSIQRAVLSELSWFRAALLAARRVQQQKKRSPSRRAGEPLPLAVVTSLRGDGKPVGSANIRLLQPLSHASVSAQVELRLCQLPDLFKITEGTIVVQRTAIPNPNTAKLLLAHCRRWGIKLALEIDDDLLHLQHKTGTEVRYRSEPLEALELIASGADRIVVSSPPLGETMREFNTQIVCVPNAHDETIWLSGEPGHFIKPVPPASHNQIRILYMGTRTHEHDLKVVEKAFKRLQKEYGHRLVLEIVGGIPDNAESFGKVVIPEGINSKSDAYVEFVHWFRRANHWHFGIIPLELTPFNRQKSYIKFLDYSALGLASICSDIEPYQAVVRSGENGLLVSNDTQAWYSAMKQLIEDPALRERLAVQAFRDLTSQFILQHRAQDFLDAYRQIPD